MAFQRKRQSKRDKRHLITVSTHLTDCGYYLLRAACRADGTKPYRMVRDFLTVYIDAAEDRMASHDDGYMCALCSAPCRLQVHHYVSRERGGCNHPMNLITLCPYYHTVIHGNTDPYADNMDAEELARARAKYLGDLYTGLGQV